MKRIIKFFSNYFNRLNTGSRSYIKDPENIPEEFDKKNPSVIINIILFIATFFTTTFAAGFPTMNISIESFKHGLPYSITLLTILLTHEFGHYFAARKFGVKSTLPYFIPFPSIIGTMGAIIRTRSPIKDRRALFYIGAMGPLPGFIVSLIAVIIGINLSEIEPLPIIPENAIIPIFGDSLLFAFIVKLTHGNIPAGHDIFLSQYAWAGWIGLLITSLNLMPVGQLDGGHIMYALLGRKQLIFGWMAFGGLIVLSFFWNGWIIWLLLILVVLMIAHPYIPEGRKLSALEKTVGWLCMLILLLTFIPVPVDFLP